MTNTDMVEKLIEAAQNDADVELSELVIDGFIWTFVITPGCKPLSIWKSTGNARHSVSNT